MSINPPNRPDDVIMSHYRASDKPIPRRYFSTLREPLLSVAPIINGIEDGVHASDAPRSACNMGLFSHPDYSTTYRVWR